MDNNENVDNDKYIIEEETDDNKVLTNLAALGQEFLRLNNEVANLYRIRVCNDA